MNLFSKERNLTSIRENERLIAQNQRMAKERDNFFVISVERVQAGEITLSGILNVNMVLHQPGPLKSKSRNSLMRELGGPKSQGILRQLYHLRRKQRTTLSG